MAAHRNDDGTEPLRQHFLGADDHRYGENSTRGCFSLHERYQRLKNGIFSRVPFDGSREKSHSSSALASTTRGILEDVQSGELPQPGMHRHLGKRMKEQLQRSAEGSREMEGGIPEHGRVPQEPCLQQQQWKTTLDLYEQNQIWMDEISTSVHFEASDVLYAPSNDSLRDVETDTDETRLQEDTPFRKRPSLPPICPIDAEPSASGQKIVGPDDLVELARNGEFSELWSALKRARLEQNHRQDSDVDAETMYYSAVDTFFSEWQEIMTAVDDESTPDSQLARRSTYFDAAASVLSKETEIPVGSRAQKRFAGVMKSSTSFQTCDTWYRDGSSVLESAHQSPLCLPPVDGVTPMDKWQRSMRHMILERTLAFKQQSRTPRCVIVLTKGPGLSTVEEQPRRNLLMPLVGRLSQALVDADLLEKARKRCPIKKKAFVWRRGIHCDDR